MRRVEVNTYGYLHSQEISKQPSFKFRGLFG